MLNSPELPTYFGWNQAFKETLPLLKDFWQVPEHAQMLEVREPTLHAAMVSGDAKHALDRIARRQPRSRGANPTSPGCSREA